MIIRKADISDLADITRVYNYAVLNTTATFDREPKTLYDRKCWFTDRNAEHPIIVAEVDGSFAGWAALGPYGTRSAYEFTVENAVYVDCDYRGRGLGKRLLWELIRLAKHHQRHCIVAQIVEGNDASIRLHLNAGFTEVGRLREVGWKFDRWLDVIVLELLLQ